MKRIDTTLSRRLLLQALAGAAFGCASGPAWPDIDAAHLDSKFVLLLGRVELTWLGHPESCSDPRAELRRQLRGPIAGMVTWLLPKPASGGEAIELASFQSNEVKLDFDSPPLLCPNKGVGEPDRLLRYDPAQHRRRRRGRPRIQHQASSAPSEQVWAQDSRRRGEHVPETREVNPEPRGAAVLPRAS